MTRIEGFEYFDVAADVGVTAWGKTLEEAAGALARGVFNLIVPFTTVEPREIRDVAVEGSDEAALLVNWINELLYLHDLEGWLLARAEVSVSIPSRLTARVWGEHFDPARHPRGILVKAATYHDLAVMKGRDGVTLRMVLDV